jgi:hypothetical protein
MGVGVVSSAIAVVLVKDDVDEILDKCDGERPCLELGELSNGTCSLFRRDALMGDDGGRRTLPERYPALTVRVSQSFPKMTASLSVKIVRILDMASSAAGLLYKDGLMYTETFEAMAVPFASSP